MSGFGGGRDLTESVGNGPGSSRHKGRDGTRFVIWDVGRGNPRRVTLMSCAVEDDEDFFRDQSKCFKRVLAFSTGPIYVVRPK